MNVSVIVPALNEEKHISTVLTALLNQDWPGEIEILVVEGRSDDKTVPIVEALAATAIPTRTIRLLANIRRNIPSALNLGNKAASHDIIIRVDGHTYPPSDLVSQVVAQIKANGPLAVVGGRCSIAPGGPGKFPLAIALAVSSPFGIGNSLYRTLSDAAPEPIAVDTVPFGAYHRAVWLKLGGYDENLLAAEDYDFNYRARRAGIAVWLLPQLNLTYIARSSLPELWRQYFRYGYWSGILCRKHRYIPALRKAAPAAFIGGVVIAAVINPLMGLCVLGVYTLANVLTSVAAGMRRQSFVLGLCMLLAFPTIHFSYGFGWLLSLQGVIRHA